MMAIYVDQCSGCGGMSVGIGGVGWSTDLSWDKVVVAGNEAEESKRLEYQKIKLGVSVHLKMKIKMKNFISHLISELNL